MVSFTQRIMGDIVDETVKLYEVYYLYLRILREKPGTPPLITQTLTLDPYPRRLFHDCHEELLFNPYSQIDSNIERRKWLRLVYNSVCFHRENCDVSEFLSACEEKLGFSEGAKA